MSVIFVFCGRLRDEKDKDDDQEDSHGCLLLPLNRGVQISGILTNTKRFIKREIQLEAQQTTLNEVSKLINP